MPVTAPAMTLGVFYKHILPDLQREHKTVDALQKAVNAFIGENPVVDEAGQPVPIIKIQMTPAGAGGEGDGNQPPKPPPEADERALAAAVKAAVDAAFKAQPKPVSDPPVPVIKQHDNWLDDPKRGFKSHVDFLSAVLVAGRDQRLPQGDVGTRLKSLSYKAVGSDEGQTGSDAYGGFFVPEGILPDFLTVAPEVDPMGAQTLKVPMDSPTVNVNARVDKDHTNSVSGGLRVYRRAETTTVTASRMTIEQIKMTADTLFGVAYATEELLNDSPRSFAAILAAGFQDEFTARIIDERLNGTGVGEFTGCINAPCTVSVAKETSQAANTIEYENIVKMRARCWGYRNAMWCFNHDCLSQLMNMVKIVGTGGHLVWQPSAREDAPDMLLGRPAVPTEFCQTLGTTGDICLCNWTQYLEGTYQPLQNASSIHVRFVNHEQAFKFWARNAGAPWWRSAMTPKHSTATLSPFVKLDTRA